MSTEEQRGTLRLLGAKGRFRVEGGKDKATWYLVLGPHNCGTKKGKSKNQPKKTNYTDNADRWAPSEPSLVSDRGQVNVCFWALRHRVAGRGEEISLYRGGCYSGRLGEGAAAGVTLSVGVSQYFMLLRRPLTLTDDEPRQKK